ncbi:hypothetical protein KK422_23365, partial [Salmonella enterica subsp. enterica serovar Infantis]|uniref:hypothetical protein n=1 Tax=Salmonella enterica TaxID=28901 RepID=UPI001CAA6345
GKTDRVQKASLTGIKNYLTVWRANLFPVVFFFSAGLYPGYFLPVLAQASVKRIVSFHLVIFCF